MYALLSSEDESQRFCVIVVREREREWEREGWGVEAALEALGRRRVAVCACNEALFRPRV